MPGANARAAEAAMRFLQRVIDTAHAEGAARLPTVKQLALSARVSHGIMNAAVAEAARSGVLDVRRSRGILLAANLPPAPSLPACPAFRSRWQGLAAQARADLATGAFGFHRPLPSHKELLRHYGVSARTLRRALGSLVSAGVLTRHGRGYRQLAPRVQAGRDTVVLFAAGGASRELVLYNVRTQDYFHSLEQECRACGVQLQFLSCHRPGGGAMSFAERDGDSFSDAVDLSKVLGFMVWQQNLTQPFLDDLGPWLLRFRRPVALFCDTDPPALTGVSRPLLRAFAFASDLDAGHAAGRYLLSLGHRHVAYFAARSPRTWQRDRLEGLVQAYREAGMPDAVRAHTAQIEGPELAETERRLMGAAAGVFSGSKSARIREQTADMWRMAFRSCTYREAAYAQLEGAFAEALADRSISAWVGANDLVALECLQYLQTRGVHMPHRISVLGFDDSFEAGYHSLTSYSFNAPAAMHAMVEYLLRPVSSRAKARMAGPVVVNGWVHERATTGVAGGHGTQQVDASDAP